MMDVVTWQTAARWHLARPGAARTLCGKEIPAWADRTVSAVVLERGCQPCMRTYVEEGEP